MFEIKLKNNKSFPCDGATTILEAAKNSGVTLEHSCLSARCRSCMVKVIEGEVGENLVEELVLSKKEKEEGFILSCNTRPLSDLKLDIEDLGDVVLTEPRTLPCKIDCLELISQNVIKLTVRFAPNTNFNFLEGQYVNIIKGGIRRSYSIANSQTSDSKLEFFIKKYENGLMSNYLFEEAKLNDLLRLEGPLGTFFYRKSPFEKVIFLATGTGIAPVKALLEYLQINSNLVVKKNILVFCGGRYEKDIFWKPDFSLKNFKFIPVLSKGDDTWKGEKGYIQDVLLKRIKNLNNVQVYACGSNQMIESSKKALLKNGLPENQFYSDAFVSSN